MGAVLGLGVGVGLLLIWSAFALPGRRGGERRSGRLHALLGSAGLAEVSPGSFLAVCGGCALVAFVALQVASRTPPVALVFAAMAGYLGGGPVFDRAVAGFASKYAAVNERDHASLLDAIASGRVAAENPA